MKILTAPRVYLVGRSGIDATVVQQFLDDESTGWVTDTDNGTELLSELAGRVCYLSFGARQGRRSNRDYLQNIIDMEHGSVLEHAVWNFIVTGVSRSFTHELIRHRAGWGYSQLSQRYVDESDTAFVEPDIISSAPELHEIWSKSVEQAHQAYMRLVEGLAARIEREQPNLKGRNKRIAARQAARSVLPNATETKVFMTANARALRHFIEYRGAPDAEPEIRKVAIALLQVMQTEAPNIFGDYTTESLADGSLATSTEHRKV
ncbi:MAG: FAD-dependent thymidylate synthase [Steroidobacteraceae bacterium]